MAQVLLKKRQIEPLNITNSDVAVNANIATSKLADGGIFIKSDGSVQYTDPQSMGNNKLTDLAEPTDPNDAVRLIDLQLAGSGIHISDPVRAATDSNITLSGETTIGGVAVVAGDRVLVKDQTNETQNGVYVVATGQWSRSPDLDEDGELQNGSKVLVQEGDYAGSSFVCVSPNPIDIGNDDIIWRQDSQSVLYNAGAGLTLTNTTFAVGTASSSRIKVNANNIDLATTGVNAGTYTKVQVDAYGRVQSGSNPSTLDGYGITNAYTKTQIGNFFNGSSSMSGYNKTEWDAASDKQITSISFNSGTGDLTLGTKDGVNYVQNLDGRYSLTTHTHELGELSDVSLTSPSNTQLLRFNGTNWVNWTPTYISQNESITFSASGDVTGSDSGTTSLTPTLTIGNNKVTFPKIQNLTGETLMGRYATTSGNVQEITLGTGLSINNSTGVLSSTGKGGTVTSVGLSAPTGFSVSGSPVTTSGTIQLNFASGYSLPSNSKQTIWDNKQDDLGTGTGGKYLYQDQTWKQIQYSEIAGTPTIPSQYTDEKAQDAVGTILSSEFTYNDTTPAISINAIAATKITEDTSHNFVTGSQITTWNNKADETIKISAGTGLTGGGTLAADRTISFDTSWGDNRYLKSFTETDPVYTADDDIIMKAKGRFDNNADLNVDVQNRIRYLSASSTGITNTPSWYPAQSGMVSSMISTNGRFLSFGVSQYQGDIPEIKWGNVNSVASPWRELAVEGSKISMFNNDAGYLTAATMPVPTLQQVTTAGSSTNNIIRQIGSASNSVNIITDIGDGNISIDATSVNSQGWARGMFVYSENPNDPSKFIGTQFGAYQNYTLGFQYGFWTTQNDIKAGAYNSELSMRLYPDGSLWYGTPPAATSSASQIFTLGSDGHTISTRTAAEILDDISAMKVTNRAKNYDNVFSTSQGQFLLTPVGAPDGRTFHGLYIPHDSSGNYGTELAFRNNEMYIRSIEAGSVNAWLEMANKPWTISNFVPAMWNSTMRVPYLATADLDAQLDSKIVSYGGGSTGAPTLAGGILMSLIDDQYSQGVQLAFSKNKDDDAWYRVNNSGTFYSWHQFSSRDWVNSQNFLSQSKWVANQPLTGTVNGTNKIFTLPDTPIQGSQIIYLNGNALTPGAGNGYTISGSTVTMTIAPKDSTADSPADSLMASYFKQ